MSVVAFIVVPMTDTVAPGTDNPSARVVTVPEIVMTSCAAAALPIASTKMQAHATRRIAACIGSPSCSGRREQRSPSASGHLQDRRPEAHATDEPLERSEGWVRIL